MAARWAAKSLGSIAGVSLMAAACGGAPALGLASSESPRSDQPNHAASTGSKPLGAAAADQIEERYGEALVSFRFDAGVAPAGPPAVGSDGRVYVATVEGYVHALGADGTFLWSYTLPRALDGGLVTDRAGVLYAAARGGRIYAVRPEGTLLWALSLPVRPSTELVPGPQGWLAFAAHDRSVYGVSRQGVARWRSALGQQIVAAPALDSKGRALVGTVDGFLYVLEPFGRRQRVELGGPISAPPRVGPDGMIWVVSGKTLFALDRDLVIRVRRSAVAAVSAWKGGAVIVGLEGELAWLRADGEVTSERAGLLAAGRELSVDGAGRAYVASHEGAVVVAAPQGDALRVRVGAAPIRALVYDGARARLLALSGDGRLAALRAAPDGATP